MSTRRVIARRWGVETRHYVNLDTGVNGNTYEAGAFGTVFEAITPPVVTLCGVVLRGTIVIMQTTYPVSWRNPEPRPIPVCPRCKRMHLRDELPVSEPVRYG